MTIKMVRQSTALLIVLLLLLLVPTSIPPTKALTPGAPSSSVAAAAAITTFKQPLRAPRGMVASTNLIASEVGADILRRAVTPSIPRWLSPWRWLLFTRPLET